MKKLIFSILLVALTCNVVAQEKGKVRIGLDAGLAFPNRGIGIDGGIDIRYNFMSNFNAGIKFGLAALAKDIVNTPLNYSATAGAATYTLFHGDYYFNKPASSFAPFLGAGAGSFTVANVHVDAANQSVSSNILTDSKYGVLLRGGFEAGKFRMALEYYMIPPSTLVDIYNARFGTTGNNFLNLSIGFYIGGGRWRNN